MVTIRKPAVAGYFYPGDRRSIESLIESFDVTGIKPERALGVVVPHAGHRYSGLVAAKVYASVTAPGSIIMLGPNHGAGRAFYEAPKAAVMAEGEWESPTGDVPIDDVLAADIMAEAPILTDAPWAHEEEHSLEVQIPFIHHFIGDTRIVPIVISDLGADEAMELGAGLARGIERSGRDVLLLASTDFSHYVPHETARARDAKAIDRILALDPIGLIEVVRRERISMCGYIPTAVVIEACGIMGAQGARLVDYKTSGDTGGDYSAVVGYGGIVIT